MDAKSANYIFWCVALGLIAYAFADIFMKGRP